jgi:predicted phosphate transport protein (TIGR00153 family)
MSLIGNLFGRSPIRPMQQHMEAALECAHEVAPLIEARASGDLAAISARRGRIDELEHRADELKHEIRGHLPQRLFLAMDRRDMLDILDFQDSIADVAQDIAEMADLRGMTIPPSLIDPMRELTERVIATCDQAGRAISQLDELVETGFGGHEVGRVEEMLQEIARLESQTDELAQTALRALFVIEDEIGVATVFWYQTIGWIGGMADYAERVGNRIRLLIAK